MQARISVLFFLFRLVHDVFLPGQGGHQHKQGGLRQVEIGDQSVNDLELVARIDEDVCPAAGGF